MLAKGAFATAATALALSGWTALRIPVETLPAPDRDAAMETGNAAARETGLPSHPLGTSPAAAAPQLAVLRAIESRVTVLEQRQGEGVARAGGSAEVASAPSPIDELPRYVELKSPEPSVEVKQGEDGSVFAINSDPALTGKVIEIEARRADDGIDTMTIVVPQPGS